MDSIPQTWGRCVEHDAVHELAGLAQRGWQGLAPRHPGETVDESAGQLPSAGQQHTLGERPLDLKVLVTWQSICKTVFGHF